jgi:Zn-dependent M28 family amino/carboxypeptidase
MAAIGNPKVSGIEAGAEGHGGPGADDDASTAAASVLAAFALTRRA